MLTETFAQKKKKKKPAQPQTAAQTFANVPHAQPRVAAHAQTPIDIRVKNIMTGYWRATGRIPAPKKVVDSLKIAKGGDWMEGVKTNVNNQVDYATKKFAEEIKEGKLTVVGAVYDFRNDLKQGQGRLVITNINGESDAAKVKANPLLSMK